MEHVGGRFSPQNLGSERIHPTEHPETGVTLLSHNSSICENPNSKLAAFMQFTRLRRVFSPFATLSLIVKDLALQPGQTI